jgi:DNA primase catalytic core
MDKIRPFLTEYLQENETEFTATHFSCPQRSAHRNNDYKPSAAYFPNKESWKCFACFKEDTPIFTDKGLVAIKDIKIGDKVLSMDGNFHKVTNTFKKEFKGEFIDIRATLPYYIQPTNYHNMYYVKKESHNLYYRDYTIYKEPAKNLVVGDYLITPIVKFPKNNLENTYLDFDNNLTSGKRKLQIKIDKLFCRVVGLFIAEGNTNGGRTVAFNFHKDENDLMEIIEKFAKIYNLHVKRYYKKDCKGATVLICNTKLARWLKDNCGHTAKNKKIPTKFLGLPEEYLKEIVQHIEFGDGHVVSNRCYVISTVSRELAYQLYLLAISFYWYPSVYVDLASRKNDNIFRQTAYHINIRTSELKGAGRFGHKNYKTGGFYLKTNNEEYYCKKIRKIKKYKEDTVVYNLEVEDTHNYLVNGAIVGNCNEAGDIFSACHFIEGRPLTGQGFITDNVLYLADKFGIKYELDEYTPEEKKKEELYKALEDACKICNQVIKVDNEKTKIVRDYVSKRQWEDLVDIFQFGYCNYEKLIELLKKKGHTEEALKEVGLTPVAEAKGNQAKYLLDNRLLFPIKNHYGRTVGFASRSLEENSNGQKYLNSRNTVLYNKTSVLFNLDKARLNSDIYVVEGYADVFSLYKHGIKNVVALCGLSFNEERYKILVKQGITKCIFVLDNDSAGKQALTRIIDKDIKGLQGINLFVKDIPSPYKDVDELLVKDGVDAFKAIKELSVFDWKLSLLENDLENEFLKNDVIKLIVLEDDYTKKEKLCQRLAKVLDVSKEAVKKEVEKHDLLDKGRRLITSEDIQEEDKCFERVLGDWDRSVWNRKGNLLGLKADKFPLFVKKMDGIQNMFYILAGDTNLGKTTLLLNLAMDMLQSNDNLFILFFSIDDSLGQLLPRIVSLNTGVPINAIANPKYKIKLREDLPEEEKEKLLRLRGEEIEKLKSMSNRFAIKEESEAKRIEQLSKYIKIYKKLSEGKQLVVFIDNLHRLTSYKKAETRELYMMISDQLKYWKNQYDIPVIATAELRKTNTVKRPIGDDIKETKDLQFDADFVGLLYNDYYKNPNTTLKFVRNVNAEDAYGPVVELNVIKNKTSSFKSRLYYKFYPEISKFVECTENERQEYLEHGF